MSIAQIEAALSQLSAEELRHLALRTWAAYVAKEKLTGGVHECEESDPALLASLDDAVRRADQAGGGVSGQEVRARISQWTTK